LLGDVILVLLLIFGFKFSYSS